jgi:uncharacterized protein YcbK (DUF882 family)
MKKKIMKFSEFILNEVLIQNGDDAVNQISAEINLDKKEKLIQDISKTYLSQDVITGVNTLKPNDNNRDVLVLQSILKGIGYLKNHSINGLLDKETMSAIQSFCKKFNVEVKINEPLSKDVIDLFIEYDTKEDETIEAPKSLVATNTDVDSFTPQSNVSPSTFPTNVSMPQSSVKKGEDVKRGVNYPIESLEKNANLSIQYSLQKDGEKNVSPNFKVKHFACRDKSDVILINPHLVDLLEKIRAKFGKEIRVNSAYRTPSYNRSLSGAAKYSQHMYGNAADITIPGVTPREIYNWVNTFHQGGLGVYPTFTHIDVRDKLGGKLARWAKGVSLKNKA